MAKRKPNRRFPRPPRPVEGREGKPRAEERPALPGGTAGSGGALWLHGVHPVLAALGNPRRRCRRLLLTEEAERAMGERLRQALAGRAGLERKTLARSELDRLLPGAVHQGLALEAEPLEAPDLDAVLRQAGAAPAALLVVLDQVTDPHNVGAILRSAAAFGALGVVVTERHAPAATAALAKAASGALETTPLLRVTNLARALDAIKEAGLWCIGLDAAAPQSLAEAALDRKLALVLGAEGAGMRRLTREGCDLLLRIPMAPAAIASLNVSNAAAVALYELARRRERGS
jgi:23S rRNA (guanosine2251-2'-O)-methyltransferase